MGLIERIKRNGTEELARENFEPAEERRETSEEREERLRAKALSESCFFEYVDSLPDEIRTDPHPWCPEIYIKDPRHDGTKWNFFTVTGRVDGSLQIGNSIPLTKKDASDPDLFHEAFNKALDNSSSIDHDPEIKPQSV